MIQTLKQIAKRILQQIAARYGRHTQKSSKPQLLILMYHRILPKQDKRAQIEEPGMVVTPETFKMHMEVIQQHFDIVSLSQWLKAKNNNEVLPSRCCAITFDDGWLDNYQYAYPILQQYQLPATIYLVSDMVGKEQMFWTERVANLLSYIAQTCPEKWSHPDIAWIKLADVSYAFDATSPDQEQLSEIIQHLKQHTDSEIHALIDHTEHSLQLNNDTPPSLLNWQQISEMCDSGLIEAGSHTRHHIRLDEKQRPDTLLHEISQSKTQIEQHLNRAVNTFCYPNGDYCEAAVELVRKHYLGAVTTDKNWNTSETDPHLLHRIGVHDDISADKTAFLARLSGWI